MSDLISRQAAIDALGDMVMNWTDSEYELGQLNQWKEDRKAIIDLPSAQPTNIQDVLEYLDTVLHPIVSPEHWNVYSELYDMISVLPSTQPEIIRCNVCRHWHQTTGEMKGFGLGDCDYLEKKLVTCNGYCYWAERKEDE